MARMPRVLRALLFSYVALQSVCNAELQDELKAAMEPWRLFAARRACSLEDFRRSPIVGLF